MPCMPEFNLLTKSRDWATGSTSDWRKNCEGYGGLAAYYSYMLPAFCPLDWIVVRRRSPRLGYGTIAWSPTCP